MDSVLLFASVSPAGNWSERLDTEAPAYVPGFVSDAHRDPRLRSEEPCRSLLDVLDRNAIRKRVVDRFEKTAGPRDAAAGVHHSSRVRERLGHASAVCDVRKYIG